MRGIFPPGGLQSVPSASSTETQGSKGDLESLHGLRNGGNEGQDWGGQPGYGAKSRSRKPKKRAIPWRDGPSIKSLRKFSRRFLRHRGHPTSSCRPASCPSSTLSSPFRILQLDLISPRGLALRRALLWPNEMALISVTTQETRHLQKAGAGETVQIHPSGEKTTLQGEYFHQAGWRRPFAAPTSPRREVPGPSEAPQPRRQ